MTEIDNIHWDFLGKNLAESGTLTNIPFLRHSGDLMIRTIVFGNTGFNINFDYRNGSFQNYFDFAPEGSFGYHPKTAVKNASILRVALLGVYEFTKNKKLIDRWNFQNEELEEISAMTNRRLVLAIKNLFLDNGHGEIIKVNRHLDEVSINLRLFSELAEEEPLILHLKRVRDRNINLIVKKSNLII